MGISFSDCITIVTKESRQKRLKARWSTKGAMKYRMQALARNYAFQQMGGVENVVDQDDSHFLAALEDANQMLRLEDLEREAERNQSALTNLQQSLKKLLPVSVIDRGDVPSYSFGNSQVIVVVGPDGLVANVAKYATGIPIVGVNPDPIRNDGILVPFAPLQVESVVGRVLDKQAHIRKVTLAKVQTSDEQTMLAFNDFYFGARTHVSARYTVEYRDQSEPHSSSGVIVSTGAGSTGWISSVINMVNAFNDANEVDKCPSVELATEADRLFWCAREPFVSRSSQADIVCGYIEPNEDLVLASQMADNGVIFSDGIEEDSIDFNTGIIAQVSVADEKAHLVTI